MLYATDINPVTPADVPSENPTVLDPSTFPSAGPRRAKTCPTCNTDLNRIGHHFGQSSCGYPILAKDEASALLGAWVAGAFVNPPEGQGTPRLIIRAADRPRLEAVRPYLGVCGRHAFEMNRGDRFQLNTTPHPALEDFYDTGRSEAVLTRRAAEVMFLLRGSCDESGRLVFDNLIDPEGAAQALVTTGIETKLVGDSVLLSDEATATFCSWAGVDSRGL